MTAQTITVDSPCLCSSCWLGERPCVMPKSAGTLEQPREEDDDATDMRSKER